MWVSYDKQNIKEKFKNKIRQRVIVKSLIKPIHMSMSDDYFSFYFPLLFGGLTNYIQS